MATRHQQTRAEKAYDAAKLKCWAKQYDPYALAWFFDLYTNPAYYGYKDEGAKVGYLPGPMSQEDAIRKIKEDFRFTSYEAAYKTLKRNPLVKGLTIHTWPK